MSCDSVGVVGVVCVKGWGGGVKLMCVNICSKISFVCKLFVGIMVLLILMSLSYASCSNFSSFPSYP